MSRGRRHLVALAAVVNYVYLRNPFVCGKNNQTDSGQIRKSIKPPAPKIQSLTNDNNISNKLKTLSCRRLETERCSVRNSDFSFRRKAQVRTYLHISFIRPYRCKGDTTRGKRKLKQGQKTAFPFPLMVSPLHTSSLNPYSHPFFIPLHFALRRVRTPFIYLHSLL